jgi:hypothetical protein
MKKKPKRRHSRQNSRRKIKKEENVDNDQEVPDVQDEYECKELLDHDSYTLTKVQGRTMFTV